MSSLVDTSITIVGSDGTTVTIGVLPLGLDPVDLACSIADRILAGKHGFNRSALIVNVIQPTSRGDLRLKVLAAADKKQDPLYKPQG